MSPKETLIICLAIALSLALILLGGAGCGGRRSDPDPYDYCAQSWRTCTADAFDYCNGNMRCMDPMTAQCDIDFRECAYTP